MADAQHEVEFGTLRPADVASLCALLEESFRRDYEAQGLEVASLGRLYRLVAWSNLLLVPLRLDPFHVVVARAGGGVVGTMASFPADAGAWYQGFGAVAPGVRRRGVYRRVIRRSLEGVAARRGRLGGGEIRTDNRGAMVPYHEAFGTELVPVRRVYLVSPERTPRPRRPVPFEAVSDRRLDALDGAERFRERFRGGFLIEREASRGLAACVARRLLPPITVRTWAWHDGERTRALARERTHWPARIRCLDAVHLDAGMSPETARDVVATLLAGRVGATGLPVRIYAAADDELLRAVCEELDLPVFADLNPIRTDVAAALARTDRDGRCRPSGGGVGPGGMP